MSTFDFDLPEFRDPDGMVWVWDAESKTYVKKPSAGLEQDRGHATGGDNDLFNQNQIEHSELAGVPELEGYMAKAASSIWDYVDQNQRQNPAAALGRATAVMAFDPEMRAEAEQVYNAWKVNPQFVEAWNDTLNWAGHPLMTPEAKQRYRQQFESLKQALGSHTAQFVTLDEVRAIGREVLDHEARQGEYAPKGQVRCPQCSEITDQPACPVCQKDLTPEWNNENESNNEFFGAPGVHDDASEFTSWPERVPKRNREKTDDSYPSMNLSSYEAAVKLANRQVTADEWDNIFNGETPLKTEVGKWLIDKQQQLHYEHGLNAYHEGVAERDGLDYPADVGALGSVYNDGTADVQKVFPDFQFEQASAQALIEQAFGPVTLQAQVGAGGAPKKGFDFAPFEVTGGQWLVTPQHRILPLTGMAWVKERPEGQTYKPNMMLVAEHLQPEDFQLWTQGCAAIITATGGLTSHAAHLAMTEGIPVIVGIGDAYNNLETGDYLKIEPSTETITVMPGATGSMSPEQKHQISDTYMQYQRARGGSVKPEFAHYDEECIWREANTPSLSECPECGDPMTDQDGESVCHSCGHKQPIIHHNAAVLAPLGEAALGGEAGGLAGMAGDGGLAGMAGGGGLAGMAGGSGSMGGGGLPGIGQLMNKALNGGAFRGGENMVGPSPHGQGGSAPADTSEYDTGAGSAGVLSSRYTTAGVISLLESLFDIIKKAPDAFVDPKNPLSYADDLAGVGLGTSQIAQQGTPEPSTATPTMASVWHFADTFGEDEVGTATKNRGDNSDPDQQSSSGADTKERGDGPEQLKDVDGPGDAKGDAFPEDDLLAQGDPALQDKAIKALHMNLPLVIEFANSDEPGSENPILLALDELIEQAFPGYKDGTGEGEDEHPVEEIHEEIHPEEKSDDEGEGEEEKSDPKEASVWHFASLDDYKHWNEEAPRVWWEEEGRHSDEPDYDPDAYLDQGYGAEDAHWEGVYEDLQQHSDDELRAMAQHPSEEPQVRKMIEQILQERQTQEIDPHIRDLEGHGGGMGAYSHEAAAWGTPTAPAPAGFPANNGDLQQMQGVGVPGVATCPICGQSHLPGTPCPTAPSAVTAPTAQGAPITPPAPNTVVTKWQVVAVDESAFEDALAELPEVTSEQNPNAENLDAEFAFFTAAGEGEHHHEVVEHRTEPGDTPWQDETGAPLEDGAQYELKSSNYAIPDRITVDRVLPDKLVYTTDSGEVKYRNEITAQDVATNDYTFAPVGLDDSPVDSADGFQDFEAPTRPGQDSGAQVDDLSTPPTVVSRVAGLEDYTGSFNGDSPDDRTWLLGDESSEVSVDPVLMAKLAGKDYSAREQREFIDEKGEARNLDRLDLDGTHYIVDDGYGDTLW